MMRDKSMSLKLENIVFLLFISYAKALRIINAPRKNKRQIITLAPPLRASHSHPSLARPPILLLEMMVALPAMDGGAFVVSVGARHRFMHGARRCDHTLLDKRQAVVTPPCRPF